MPGTNGPRVECVFAHAFLTAREVCGGVVRQIRVRRESMNPFPHKLDAADPAMHDRSMSGFDR